MTSNPVNDGREESAKSEIKRILRQAEMAYRLFIFACLLVFASVLLAIFWVWRA